MPWTTIELQTTTPLFNGGADGDAGFRISSLRGAMRFWFRALAGLGIGDNLSALATLERHVFGATDRASPVKLRVAASPTPHPPGQPAWCQGTDGRWIVYLLGQGLGSLRRPVSVIRPYIEAGQNITIQLRLDTDPDIAALVLASLWLTCTFGGLGARTRRGFGGLRITNADDALPEPWTPQRLRTPGLDFYQGIEHLWPTGPVGSCMPILYSFAKAHHAPWATATTPPQYPLLSRAFTAAGLSGGESSDCWSDVLSQAGEQLRHFRASRPAPEAGYRPPVKTPEWLDVVHGPQTQFALGALGLPVNFRGHSKITYTANAHEGRTGEALRRASPLWLRPVGHDKDWRLLSFAFHGEFLPDTAETRLHQGSRLIKPLAVDQSDVVKLTNKWINILQKNIRFN